MPLNFLIFFSVCLLFKTIKACPEFKYRHQLKLLVEIWENEKRCEETRMVQKSALL